MRLVRAQGAIELNCAQFNCRHLAGQGATEYLVLLAVVLIVALVSVALLGFFPGMASDAQITQSKAYWQSAQPISIIESGAGAYISSGNTYLYLRMKNNGAYPIRITGIVGSDGLSSTQVNGNNCGASGWTNISTLIYMGPGEEKYIAAGSLFGTACNWLLAATTGASSTGFVGGASSVCQNSTASPGTLDYKTLGFEYIQYIENQQITKRQIGKDIIVKCLPPA